MNLGLFLFSSVPLIRNEMPHGPHRKPLQQSLPVSRSIPTFPVLHNYSTITTWHFHAYDKLVGNYTSLAARVEVGGCLHARTNFSNIGSWCLAVRSCLRGFLGKGFGGVGLSEVNSCLVFTDPRTSTFIVKGDVM